MYEREEGCRMCGGGAVGQLTLEGRSSMCGAVYVWEGKGAVYLGGCVKGLGMCGGGAVGQLTLEGRSSMGKVQRNLS